MYNEQEKPVYRKMQLAVNPCGLTAKIMDWTCVHLVNDTWVQFQPFDSPRQYEQYSRLTGARVIELAVERGVYPRLLDRLAMDTNDDALKQVVEQINAARERIARDEQEKRERERRQRAEKNKAALELRVGKAEKDLVSGLAITGEAFLELLKSKGEPLRPNTIGSIKKLLSFSVVDGSVRYLAPRGYKMPGGVFNLILKSIK